ncbi:MAG TPA: isocitrate lyase/phosphoenolpyruvate mutase family protein [Sphingobium sp.]
MSQAESYARFKALHERPGIFVMPNVWDAASAALLAREGFEAIASSSIAIAFMLGKRDGAHDMSREEAVSNAGLLARVSGLPVNGDLEDGFGTAPEDCVATVEAAIAAGLAGLGIEDTTADPAKPIHDFDAAVARIAAAAKVAKGRIVLTGRTDLFLHGQGDLEEAIRRLTAFAEAGADVLYAPGLPTLDAIKAVVRAVSPLPVNVVMGPSDGLVPVSVLEEAGVKRLSLGGTLQRRAYDGLIEAARSLKAGDVAGTRPTLTSKEIAALLS